MAKLSVYASILEDIFFSKFREGMTQVDFERSDIPLAAGRRGVKVPSNVGDVIYAARYRNAIPESILNMATPGHEWTVPGRGSGHYSFVLSTPTRLAPNEHMATTKVPDAVSATPVIIAGTSIAAADDTLEWLPLTDRDRLRALHPAR